MGNDLVLRRTRNRYPSRRMRTKAPTYHRLRGASCGVNVLGRALMCVTACHDSKGFDFLQTAMWNPLEITIQTQVGLPIKRESLCKASDKSWYGHGRRPDVATAMTLISMILLSMSVMSALT